MGNTAEVFGHPQHPCTRNLLSAVPELHQKRRQLDAEVLEPAPPLVPVGPGHLVADAQR